MTLTPDDLDGIGRQLAKHEGFSPVVYKDTMGQNTIGYGILVDPPGGITIEEAKYLRDNRVRWRDEELSQRDWYRNLAGPRKWVIVNMSYQLGVEGVRKFHKMIAAIVKEDWNTAADEMLNSAWHTQTPKRCEELAAQMRNGSYP